MQKKVIDPNKSYTFRHYFELNPPIRELLAYFGYHLHVETCQLPHSEADMNHFAPLKTRLETHLRHVPLNSEAARREVLVGPILFELAAFLEATVDIEYPLQVTPQLKGKVDYYIKQNSNLLVVEAKNDDLGRGFTQLATELIALDHWLEADERPLYGCITIGDAWRFAILDRQTKRITQDIRIYTVPHELYELLQILIALLEN